MDTSADGNGAASANGGGAAGAGAQSLASSGAKLDFKDVFIIKKGRATSGRLKFAEKGFAFKNSSTGKVEQVFIRECDTARWMKVARGYQLRFVLSSGAFATFDGFKKEDEDGLRSLVEETFKLPFEEELTTSIGWNWGKERFEGSTLSFVVKEKTAFEIPLNAVTNSHHQKTEATLEFHVDDEGDAHMLESMRFVVFGRPEDEEPTTHVQEFVEQVLEKADITEITGEAIATFPEMPCITPRGRYEIQMYPSFLRLHGKTFDYKITYEQVVRLFVLPKPDMRHVYFCVNLDPPIRQGMTRYPFLILQFLAESEVDLPLNLDSEEAQEKLQAFGTELKGHTWEVVSRVFKALTGSTVTAPGDKGFKNEYGANAVKCTHKASDGYLYPLNKAFLYVYKPAIHLRFDQISSISFERVHRSGSVTSQSFDINVELKNGASYAFNSIPHREYSAFYKFIQAKKLHIANLSKPDATVAMDDDFAESDDDFDPYMNRMRSEGGAAKGAMDSSSDDEDFEAESSSSGSDSLEYDSEDSGDSEDEKDKAKKAKKAAKRKAEKKRKAAELGSDDDAGAKRKPSKKKAKKKDPNRPKKPPNAYQIFSTDNRARVKAENPESKPQEMMSLLSAAWRAVGEEEKKEYEAKAQMAKEGYRVAMAEYAKTKPPTEDELDDDSGDDRKKKKRKKKAEDPNRPKRPLSAYMLFCAEEREKVKADNPDMVATELMKKVGELWGKVDSERKAQLEDKSKQLKVEYKAAMEEYLKTNPEAEATSPRKKAKKKKPAAPKEKTQSTLQYKSAEFVVDSDEDA